MLEEDILGLTRHIGDHHYRAYIGPPDEYDLVSAMTFGLLTACGLRQHHNVLDIGCGSLRLGRLLIPYLNTGKYFGLDPNKWLIDDGLQYEVGTSLIDLRKPTFLFDSDLQSLSPEVKFDYVVAQSIFSHTAPDLLERWITDVALRLNEHGALFATVLEGTDECTGEGWVYPECVEYQLHTVAGVARSHGLEFSRLDWYHPRQTWCAIFREGFDAAILNDGNPSWNHFGAQRTKALTDG